MPTKKIGNLEDRIENVDWLQTKIPDTDVNLAEITSLKKNPSFARMDFDLT